MASAVAVALRLMSVNVQTLASVDTEQTVDSDAFSGRAAYLREQCRYHGVHVLAVQESRSHSTETIQSHSHIRLCSGRDAQGHHGIELWIDKQLPVNPADGEAIRIQLSDLLVLAADPRTLIVRLSRRGLHILFVATHAPIATSAAREAWWSELAVRVTRFRQGCQVVVLGDYNAHFGEPIPHRVGDLVWPSQGCLPAGLLTLLSQQDLWLPSTYRCCHVDPSETWITPNGSLRSQLTGLRVQVPHRSTTILIGARRMLITIRSALM